MISLLPLQDASDFAALTLLSLVQGLTEFLPISSSGHLVLAQAAMGFEEPALALDVALHVGTLLAVAIVYRKAILKLIQGVGRGELREVLLLGLATVPAGVIGVLFRERIGLSFHDPGLASIGLFVTAGVLVAGEWARRRNADAQETVLGWKQALLIGCAQAFAICPGISRSGATIAMGMLCGRSPANAARFSFLLSIPAILGAAVLSLPEALEGGLAGGIGPVLWAAGFAGFVGWGALRVLLAFLGRGAFTWFAAYCVGLGTGALMFS